MCNKQKKKATVDALDLMIRHADKGPSGFWVDDREGCGNPAIFPEFEDGLKRGGIVNKEHYYCPWNTAIMYGDGHGSIGYGCYYSCSIQKARYLSEKELKGVLNRFKTRLENGVYDRIDHLVPLLTESEKMHIEERILAEKYEREQQEEYKRQERLKKASALIKKYPNEKELIVNYYGENECRSIERGIIFFNLDSRQEVVGAEKMSYDEYLDVQLASLGYDYRHGFANGIFNELLEFKGQIEKVNAEYICFKRIFISGMYPDGEWFDDKEEHVWMDKSGFEEFVVGDSVSFYAEVYRYIKKGNGKVIDYGLRNPANISKIDAYKLPTDEELMMQDVRQIMCEACFFAEQCNRTCCMMDSRERRSREREMFNAIKTSKEIRK